jgi:hypothetical protein
VPPRVSAALSEGDPLAGAPRGGEIAVGHCSQDGDDPESTSRVDPDVGRGATARRASAARTRRRSPSTADVAGALARTANRLIRQAPEMIRVSADGAGSAFEIVVETAPNGSLS